MSPPTIPSPNSPAAEEVANIIVGALRERGFDAGITNRLIANQWKDFDLIIFWNNITVGSKRRNRSYLQVMWDKRIIKFSVFGRRWDTTTAPGAVLPDPVVEIDLASPDSLNEIADFIEKTAIEDKYRYPFL